MTTELWLILIYTVVVGVGDLRAAKLGIQIGPLPLFLTDMTLLALLLVSFARWPSRLLLWMSAGIEAGTIGHLAWMLWVVAIVYFALAVPHYHIYAARDLAIFGYCLFFPLTYFAIRDRHDAVRLLRYFNYAGALLSVAVLLQVAGLHTGLFTGGDRIVMGRRVLAIGAQDASAFSVFSFAGLLAYTVLDSRLRAFHAGLAVVCFLAVAASTSRAAVVAVGLVSCLTLVYAGAKYRTRAAFLVASFLLLVVYAPELPATLPGVDLLRNLRISVISAANGPTVDPTSEFRLIRWHYAAKIWMEHPIFGEGFGKTIIPGGLVDSGESQGEFNAGMPHNTFLFLAARTGLMGLGLVLLCWYLTFSGLLKRLSRARDADELAVVNILLAMFGFAAFVLFFERPVTNAAFWIVLAIGSRLTEYRTPQGAGSFGGLAYAVSTRRS